MLDVKIQGDWGADGDTSTETLEFAEGFSLNHIHLC